LISLYLFISYFSYFQYNIPSFFFFLNRFDRGIDFHFPNLHQLNCLISLHQLAFTHFHRPDQIITFLLKNFINFNIFKICKMKKKSKEEERRKFMSICKTQTAYFKLVLDTFHVPRCIHHNIIAYYY